MDFVRNGSRSNANVVTAAVLMIVTAVSRSGDDGDGDHVGQVCVTI